MKTIAVSILIIGVLTSGSFGAVTIDRVNVNPQRTTALAQFNTTGDDMAGMQLRVNGTDTATWAITGAEAGGATGTGWSLTETGDTGLADWTLSSSIGMQTLFIDAGPGDTVFDTIPGVVDTPGSEVGIPFELQDSGGFDGDIRVTYTGPVRLTGAAFAGDLYRFMRVEFTTPFTGTLTFRADTDNAAVRGDIIPVIPAPGALVLASLGSAVWVWIRRRAGA